MIIISLRPRWRERERERERTPPKMIATDDSRERERWESSPKWFKPFALGQPAESDALGQGFMPSNSTMDLAWSIAASLGLLPEKNETPKVLGIHLRLFKPSTQTSGAPACQKQTILTAVLRRFPHIKIADVCNKHESPTSGRYFCCWKLQLPCFGAMLCSIGRWLHAG